MLNARQILVLCALALLGLGGVMVHSAGLSVGGDGPGVSLRSILLSRPTAHMTAALLAMIAASRLPVRRLTGGVWPGWALAGALLACLLVYAPVIGREVNGAHRWIAIPLGGERWLSMQPSELAKWTVVVFTAWWAARRAGQIERFWTGLAPALAAVGLVAAVITLEDLGTGALIAMVAGLVLLAGGARLGHFAMLAPFALLALIVAVVIEPYRVRRISAFLNPYADPQGAGYHAIQSMAAVARGDVTGRGLGFGVQKFGYLPEDQTDFVFAVIAEELGLAGAALVLALLAGLLHAAWRIVRPEPDAMLRLAGLGVIATIGLQAMINLAAVTGLGPTKGIALPLVSAGGTGWVFTAGAIGALVAMDRTRAGEPCEKRGAALE